MDVCARLNVAQSFVCIPQRGRTKKKKKRKDMFINL